MDLQQNGLYSRNFDKISAPGLIFHLLQLVIQSQLLVSVIMGEAAAEFQRGSDTLKQRSQLLNHGLRGEVVFRRGLALAVFVSKFLGSREGQLAIAGVDLTGKIMRLGGQIEDAGAGCVRECEVGFVGLAFVGRL